MCLRLSIFAYPYRVASVGRSATATDLRAGGGLGHTPRKTGLGVYAIGVDGERAGCGVVLGADEAGEGRGGEEEGRVEHAGLCVVFGCY